MLKNIIYLDNAATTKIDSRVVVSMKPFLLDEYGNASARHHLGENARKAVEGARKIIANSIHAAADELVFTSGGTEANNFALKGLAFAAREKNSKKKHIITTKIEHSSVLETCSWLKRQGFVVTYLDVDENGFVDLKQLEREITSRTIVVSVIHGNNEIGTIQDLTKIGKICREKNVLFHADACQSFAKTTIDVNRMKLDLVSLNAHKLHGPKGVGALFIRRGVKITSLLHGGGQERGRRAGTENVAGIVGFARALEITDGKKEIARMEKLRDMLIEGILREIADVKLNGPVGKKRLCNNCHISFSNCDGETIVGLLDNYGICVSSGSACAELSMSESSVLKAIGLDKKFIRGSVRFSLSKFTTESEIKNVLKILPKVVETARQF